MSATDEIKKEFELERVILFSDAVFAIAITLLILEVKFPVLHKNMSSEELAIAFKPVYVQLLAFIISFFFIGIMWAKHLEIFKYLRNYDRKIIFLNLLFLFFIVCFPFSASAFSENTATGLAIPMMIYLGNIACLSIVKAILSHYLFGRENDNIIPGKEKEKKYMYLEGIWSAIILSITVVLVIGMAYFSEGDPSIMFWPFYLLGPMSIILQRKLKKYKPEKKPKTKNTEVSLIDI